MLVHWTTKVVQVKEVLVKLETCYLQLMKVLTMVWTLMVQIPAVEYLVEYLVELQDSITLKQWI